MAVSSQSQLLLTSTNKKIEKKRARSDELGAHREHTEGGFKPILYSPDALSIEVHGSASKYMSMWVEAHYHALLYGFQIMLQCTFYWMSMCIVIHINVWCEMHWGLFCCNSINFNRKHNKQDANMWIEPEAKHTWLDMRGICSPEGTRVERANITIWMGHKVIQPQKWSHSVYGSNTSPSVHKAAHS